MGYSTEIKETLAELDELERSTKDLKARDRIRFLGYLKSGQAQSQQQAGELLGIGLRQSQRLWRRYREKGLADMLQPAGPRYAGKLTAEQKAELSHHFKKDDMVSLEQARRWIEERYRVHYTIGGVSALFKRLKIKL